jgi:hypothetical protein
VSSLTSVLIGEGWRGGAGEKQTATRKPASLYLI